MIGTFVEAFFDAFKHVQSIDNIRPSPLWTNDPIIRTSTMQSYIYPRIAEALGKYMVYELPTDAAFFDFSEIINAGADGLAYPNPQKAILCLEHENNSATSQHEMHQLSQSDAALNVLITYQHGTEEQQIAWLERKFSKIIVEARGRAADFLIVLPGAEQDQPWSISEGRPWSGSDLWRFFYFEKSRSNFERYRDKVP